MVHGKICLRGVEVHNLCQVDLDLPHRKWIVLCGVSGSGKTSLALDTLYAEGQRRYIDSFSTYSRQFLERLSKPAAQRIEGIPPAIAVTHKNRSRSNRATIATVTEISAYLALLWAKVGRVVCQGCGQFVERDRPETIAARLRCLTAGTRLMIACAAVARIGESSQERMNRLREAGTVRALCNGQWLDLATTDRDPPPPSAPVHVIIDRLVVGKATQQRLCDSLETALSLGEGTCFVYLENREGPLSHPRPHYQPGNQLSGRQANSPVEQIDGKMWSRWGLSDTFACTDCDQKYLEPEPRLLSFNSPLGACPECEGFGSLVNIDMDRVVPHPEKSLRQGAIAPWNSPAYRHKLTELLQLAREYQIPVDVPFADLEPAHRELLWRGIPDRNFGGLKGFFAYLERNRYKMHLRVFLSRWRSFQPCPTCEGQRFRPEALAVQISSHNLANIYQMKIRDALEFFRSLKLQEENRCTGHSMIEQVTARLAYLKDVGVGYLTLDRRLRTLSVGEMQRVTLTSALGSSLVGMLYVLDEPSVGMHPQDMVHLVQAIAQLCRRGNTLVVVDHDASIIRACDEVVELGPGAGESGGRIVFQGTPQQMLASPGSLTGDWLAGRCGKHSGHVRRAVSQGMIRLRGARGNNLKALDVDFPLGLLCLVTGVSGSGKSTLVLQTLVPALLRQLRREGPKPLPHDDLLGVAAIDDLVVVDQKPIGRSTRTNPVTYIKAFDEIRAVFANTVDAKTHNFGPSHFSFNVEGGRCETCQGAGQISIDMQFLADVYMQCSQCAGRRYRRDILKVKYRNRSIADVLDLTVREALAFFRGHLRVQARLQPLVDVGLEYLRLGQPVNTISSGEAQRLKLGSHLAANKRGRLLFVLDEPTTGLHFADIVRLLNCFDSLLTVGHSLIVVEHHLQVMQAADYLIDLGPGAADEGGQVVAAGTPEQIAQHPQSSTGKFLVAALNSENHGQI